MLLYVRVLSCFSFVRLFATLWTSAGCQASLSMRFSKQEYWSRLPCPPPGDFPDPGIEPRSPALTLAPPRKGPLKSRVSRKRGKAVIAPPFFFLNTFYSSQRFSNYSEHRERFFSGEVTDRHYDNNTCCFLCR